MGNRRRARGSAVVAVVLATIAGTACSEEDAPSDELLRIEGPAQVDPSFEGIDGREP